MPDEERRGPQPDEIHECPACHARVIVRADYGCPSCRADMRYVPDDGLRRITVGDSAILPAVCAHCGAPAEHYRPTVSSRVLDDGGLHWFWRTLASLIMSVPKGLRNRQVVSVTVEVPYCSGCRDCAPLRPEYVRSADRKLTLLVHTRLREAVDAALSDG